MQQLWVLAGSKALNLKLSGRQDLAKGFSPVLTALQCLEDPL